MQKNLKDKDQKCTIGFLGTDIAKSNGEVLRLAPLPSSKIYKPFGAVSNFIPNLTPEGYLKLISKEKQHLKFNQVLMYAYGAKEAGLESGIDPLIPGLPQRSPDTRFSATNILAWSPSQLRRLHKEGLVPFVGLESLDPEIALRVIQTLKAAGYTKEKIFIRIAAEPSVMDYGKSSAESLPFISKTHAKYMDPLFYKMGFAHISNILNASGLNFVKVFAPCIGENMTKYAPDPKAFDAIGVDFYATPANIGKLDRWIGELASEFPDKALVVPELGIATSGSVKQKDGSVCTADLKWAENALKKVLAIMDHHFHGRVAQVTPFSVDAANRVRDRNWSWAWSDGMLDTLQRTLKSW